MAKNKTISIKELFQGLQNQMEAQLNTNRDHIEHPGSKGDSLENVWIEWLKTYLPNRYGVDKAFVVDSNGDLSDQIDVVIYDQHFTPFIFTQNGVHYIPAEGVYAVFEVKPDIKGAISTSGDNYIAYAGKKIESVRKLKRTSTEIVDKGQTKDPRPLTKIIGGILASLNSYNNKNTPEKHLKQLTGLKGIDMGCIVEFGNFYIDYKGFEDQEVSDLNERIRKYYEEREINYVEFSKREDSLITFFLQLSRYLQQSIGTVAAIDFNAYANQVGFKIDSEI